MGTAALLWPAALNGYPLVFADTGTYLSQVPALHLGWDRPPFYSLLILPLHLLRTLWPVVVAQALLAVLLLRAACRRTGAPPTRVIAMLALASPLPFLVCTIMPDALTAPLVLGLTLAITGAGWRTGRTAAGLAALIATHLTHLPIALGVTAALAVLVRRARPRVAVAGCALAALGWVAVNAVGHGRASLAPFGDTFVLARMIEDGSARETILANCPEAGWRLCAEAGALPATADGFLWSPESPLARLGGPVALSDEIEAITRRTIRERPGAVARAALDDAATQLVTFRTGDGLRAWPTEVTPWIAGLFPPSELRAYDAARQTRSRFGVPDWLATLHASATVLGLIGCVLALRRDAIAPFALAALVAFLVNACVTGALSGPHARYQSRVAWLPVAVAAMMLPVRLPLPAMRAVPA